MFTNSTKISIYKERYNRLISRGFYNHKIAAKIMRKIRALEK